MKCCVWCKYFHIDAGRVWSEHTVEDASIGCYKDVWFINSLNDQKEFQGYSVMAENCEHFEIVDELKDKEI